MPGHCTHVIARTIKGVEVIEFTRPDVLDASFIEKVEAEIEGVMKTADPPRLVVDFSAVHFMSSTGIAMLVRLQGLVRERGGDLALSNVGEGLLQVFKITRMDLVLEVYPDTKQAVAALNRGTHAEPKNP